MIKFIIVQYGETERCKVISIIFNKKYRVGIGYVIQKVKPIFFWSSVKFDRYLWIYIKMYQFNLIRYKNFALGVAFSKPCDGEEYWNI
jgi:hypothetical protein